MQNLMCSEKCIINLGCYHILSPWFCPGLVRRGCVTCQGQSVICCLRLFIAHVDDKLFEMKKKKKKKGAGVVAPSDID